MLGKNIIFMLDNKQVAGCVNCEIDMNYSTLEIANPTDGKARMYMFERYTWKLSSSHIIPSLHFAVEDFFGKTFNIVIGELIGDGFRGSYRGEVLCTNSKTTTNNHSIAKGAFTFIGNGALIPSNE